MLRNWLFESFSANCQKFIQDRSLIKPITSGEILAVEHTSAQTIIFPLEGLVSLQVVVREGKAIEVASVGRDGAIGGRAVLGITEIPYRAVVIAPGQALSISTNDFSVAADKFPSLQRSLIGWSTILIRRLAQSVACTSIHHAEQRIACWLLHASDRVGSSKLDVAQIVLARNLGLRPTTVSDVCRNLALHGAIDYNRSGITVSSRTQLMARSCGCYEAAEEDRSYLASGMERLVGD